MEKFLKFGRFSSECMKIHGPPLPPPASLAHAHVHEHLSWKPHMELLLQKIRINTEVVRRIQHYLYQEILLLLYNSMVKSHLQNCILTWCNGNKTLLQTLQRAANKFIWLIFKLNYRESVKNTMQQNRILTINQFFWKWISLLHASIWLWQTAIGLPGCTKK